MSVDPRGFPALMALIAQGDQQAATQLFHLYKDDVLEVIRSRLKRHKRLRSLLDAEDVAQDVWAALFVKAKRQDFTMPKDFRKYIRGMVHRQVNKAMRKHLDAQKRDPRRIHHLSDPNVSFSAIAVADPHLPPDRMAAFVDERDRWLSSLTARERRVASMILNDFSHREIAAEFDCSERSIERTIADLREKPPPENIPNL